MPDENPIPARSPAERLDAGERDVLYLLTGGDQPLWTVDEL